MRSYCVAKSTSTATTASATISGDSQPESATEQHHQGSFADLLTTVYTPESTSIPADSRSFAGLRLLAEVSTSQLNPFETPGTHRTITFDDEDQEQSASSLSLPDGPLLSNEPSQATDDANPIMEIEEPKPRSDQNLVDQNADSTDKWIMYSSDDTRPFQCGHEGCGKTYMTKQGLRGHFISHIGDSQFRCYTGDCTGEIRFCDSQALARHIHITHTMERPFKCNICNKRFSRSDKLRHHKEQVHSPGKEQNTKKEKKSPPKRKRKVNPPFEALATHRPITFDDEDQKQSASSLSLPDKPLLPNEPSPANDDTNPIREVAVPHEAGISEVPKRASDQNLAIQDSDSTDKWIMCSGDKTKSFKCGYKGCGRIYTSKQNLRKHLASHIGGSQFRCYSGDCDGTVRYYDSQALARHIHTKHLVERPFECNICNQRFRRRAHLQRHQQQIYSTEKEQTTKKVKITIKTKEKITKNGRTSAKADNRMLGVNL